MQRISLPEPLDSLLNGLEAGSVTNIYGGPGTGKTNCCLMAALDCFRRGGRSLFIDTEGGFSPERLRQLEPEKWRGLLDRIELVQPKSFQEQGKVVRGLGKRDFNFIVVDSMVALYRIEYTEKGPGSKNLVLEANRELSKQVSVLSNLARERGIPVLITAHTFKNWDTGEDEVIGGNTLRYWSKVILFLERTGRMSERKATLVKHRHLPEGKQAKFELVENGIKPAGFRIF
ncbi:MAG: DNA repair and recombination protein RadB [Candidatus Aenigmatarchaeota archaeon]